MHVVAHSFIGSRFAVRGSRFAVRGSRFAVRGSRFAVRGSRFAVRGSRFAEMAERGGSLPNQVGVVAHTIFEAAINLGLCSSNGFGGAQADAAAVCRCSWVVAIDSGLLETGSGSSGTGSVSAFTGRPVWGRFRPRRNRFPRCRGSRKWRWGGCFSGRNSSPADQCPRNARIFYPKAS